MFEPATSDLDPHGSGWALHQLRHSALQHLAAAGRTAPELQAKSRHQHLAGLGGSRHRNRRQGHRRGRPGRPGLALRCLLVGL